MRDYWLHLVIPNSFVTLIGANSAINVFRILPNIAVAGAKCLYLENDYLFSNHVSYRLHCEVIAQKTASWDR
jgi:Gpi18-like mannosyltransferase